MDRLSDTVVGPSSTNTFVDSIDKLPTANYDDRCQLISDRPETFFNKNTFDMYNKPKKFVYTNTFKKELSNSFVFLF